MIVKPKIKGFICTTAHPIGCEKSVNLQVKFAKENQVKNGPKRVLVIGSSGGYGLASRIMVCFGCGSDTIGVHFDKTPSINRTGTAGFYTSRQFDRLAQQEGHLSFSINGDAFSDETKSQVINAIKLLPGGQIDCVIYSLAAPRKVDAISGQIFNSVIKPIGTSFEGKTVDFNSGEISIVDVMPANDIEIEETVEVMGGGDWNVWIELLLKNNMLAKEACTIAYSYIGPEQTYAIYTDGTIGRAKMDLEKTSHLLNEKLKGIHGKAFVSINKALVTQASAAIPVVPLYIMVLYKVMKEMGLHENCIEQAQRLFSKIYNKININYDEIAVDYAGRIRLDDAEMREDVQNKVKVLLDKVTSENIYEITDIQGYKDDFLQIFGFNFPGVNYDSDVDTM